MKIKQSIYKKIVNEVNKKPPETGGIIGGNSQEITTFYHDKGVNTDKICRYTPNIMMINAEIERWQSNGVLFLGMYHTHYWGIKTLSEADKYYIRVIMEGMPEEISELYFPIIVFPEEEIIWYKAIKGECQIEAANDVVLI